RTWQASDCCSNTTLCSQIVTVVDTTPPLLAGCQNICTTSTPGSGGSVVNYLVSATDNCDGTLAVSCVPPSGSFFPEGQTVVTCSTADHCGNSNSCNFAVTVRAPITATGPTNQTVCEGAT